MRNSLLFYDHISQQMLDMTSENESKVVEQSFRNLNLKLNRGVVTSIGVALSLL